MSFIRYTASDSRIYLKEGSSYKEVSDVRYPFRSPDYQFIGYTFRQLDGTYRTSKGSGINYLPTFERITDV